MPGKREDGAALSPSLTPCVAVPLGIPCLSEFVCVCACVCVCLCLCLCLCLNLCVHAWRVCAHCVCTG